MNYYCPCLSFNANSPVVSRNIYSELNLLSVVTCSLLACVLLICTEMKEDEGVVGMGSDDYEQQ